MKTGIFIPVFFLPFLPFCRGGMAPPCGRRSVHFCILRVVGTSAARRAAERTFFHFAGGGD